MIGVVKKIVFPEPPAPYVPDLVEIIGVLFQSGTAAPIVRYIKNDFPISLSASYNSSGDYKIYDASNSMIFQEAKVSYSISQPEVGKATAITRLNANEFRIQTSMNGILNWTEFRITMKRSDVYPT